MYMYNVYRAHQACIEVCAVCSGGGKGGGIAMYIIMYACTLYVYAVGEGGGGRGRHCLL